MTLEEYTDAAMAEAEQALENSDLGDFSPMTQIHVHTEGDHETYSFEEYADEMGSVSWPALACYEQWHLDQDQLADEVIHKEDVVERATEEDVFFGKIRIPGWFVNKDDDLRESHGRMNRGSDLALEGLIEDYSEKAWRVVARLVDRKGGTDTWYAYEWAFVPKSVSTVFHVELDDDMDAVDEEIRKGRDRVRQQNEDFEKADWEEQLEMLDG